MVWRATDPQGNEAAKIKWEIVPYTRGRGLDLGCGTNKPFFHFTGVDNLNDCYQFGMPVFRPDVIVESCEKLELFADANMDFVFSSHLLEHIEDTQAALREWFRLVKVGGHLVLYLPHKHLYPNIGKPGSNPDHKHDFMPNDIVEAMHLVGAGWDLLENQTRGADREYSFYQVYRKRADRQHVEHPVRKMAAKRACVVRYGGFGDMIQASSIFPALKAQGYSISVMTTPRGHDILKHDPHVADFILQDTDQVPNQDLGAYWACWRKKFDKWVNLSESVETSLLASPGHSNHAWPDALRHKMLNVNYLEFTHALAEVPALPHPKFYPSEQESKWALDTLPAGFKVLVVLTGSSVHKAWPHLDNLMAMALLECPELRFVLTGDAASMMLEDGWQKESRVMRACNKWTIRQTMAAAMLCDVVLGPETGVLNAVSFEPTVGKIVLLSHSSPENLTRGWPNTDTIEPVDTPCYPCHRLHYTREFCPSKKVRVQDDPIGKIPELVAELTMEGHIKDGMFDTGAALCAYSITPQVVFTKLKERYERWRADRRISATG